MLSFIAPAALAAIAIIPSVSAHGFVQTVNAGGKSYPGGDPTWFWTGKGDSVGWYADNQDNGFVAPDAYQSPDIICHKGATPGNKVVEVQAGEEIELVWNTWPESHHGPVVNHLARCHGDCTKVDKERLNFFSIQEEGLIDPSREDGWASDEIIRNGNVAKVTIPANLKGNFVLRHEIIALHSANNADGAQNYPQCINLKVVGNGKAHPCDNGADCRKGTELYTADEDGILFNIYIGNTNYQIPGPKVFKTLAKRVAMAFKA